MKGRLSVLQTLMLELAQAVVVGAIWLNWYQSGISWHLSEVSVQVWTFSRSLWRSWFTTRSYISESTWSSDSNAYRTSRRSSNFRDPDVNGVFDSISIISEMVSDSDVFVNDVWQAKTGSSVRQEYMSASTVSPIRSGGMVFESIS